MAESDYHLIPQERKFRHSSVRGDFRVLLTASGFVTSWKTVVSARDLGGKQTWRLEGHGRAMDVSPDGGRLLSFESREQTVGIYDIATGKPLVEPRKAGEWVDSLAWFADGSGFLGSNSGKGVYQWESRKLDLVRKVDAFLALYQYPYVSNVVSGNDPRTALVTCSNGDALHQIDLTTGAVLASVDASHPSDMFYSRDREQLVCVGSYQFSILDARTLKTLHCADFPGKQGVKVAGAPGYGEHFKPMAKLAPSRKLLALNDQAGQLWRVELPSLKADPIPREVVDYVEDFAWVDDATVIAITNDTRIARVDVGSMKATTLVEKDMPD